MLKLGKYKAQEIVLLMLCEMQGDRLAADFNCSKLFGSEKNPLILYWVRKRRIE